MLSSTVFQNFDIVKYSIFIEGVHRVADAEAGWNDGDQKVNNNWL